MSLMQIGSIQMQVNRKQIKNLHISVMPPDGRVRVSAPRSMTEVAIQMAVVSRIPWIRKQQKHFSAQPRQSVREMVNGECHYLWGRRHRLNIIERVGKHEVKVSKSKITFYINPGTTLEKKEQLLAAYQRKQLKERVTALLEYWPKMVGVAPAAWGIRKMRTKWGSCNTSSKRIWLNLELAKKPPECLEYILVHELIHLLERKHNERFRAYMQKHLPDWRERRNLLNSMPLAHQNWVY